MFLDVGGVLESIDTSQYVSNREKTLEEEVTCLRNELFACNTEKAHLENRLKHVKYEADTKLENEIDSLKEKMRTIESALHSRLEHITEGDLFMIDSQQVANTLDKPLLMQIAKKYGCNFVAMAGLEHIKRLTEIELEKMNLRRLVPGERPTASQRLESIAIDLRAKREEIPWTQDELAAIDQISTGLDLCIKSFLQFEILVNQRGSRSNDKLETAVKV